MPEAIAKREIGKPEIALAGLGAITALALALARVAPLLVAARVKFPVQGFFEPAKVAWVADQLPQDNEDEFILAAWDFAADIPYEPVGTDLDFVEGEVVCDGCYSVVQTLNRELGNCVGKSALLASILLNRIEQSRVFMAVGHYLDRGRSSGHAWVELERDGDLYLLESTQPPSSNPWRLATRSSAYTPYATFSQERFDCLNHSFCIQAGRCNCEQAVSRFVEEIL
jgi:hypothetical protein